jgi:hypothetical protein
MKTLLQTVTDLLEAGGVRVLGVNLYPPDEGELGDGIACLTLRIPTKKSDYELKGDMVNDFIRDCVIYDDKWYELADVVYTVYKEYIENRSADLLVGKARFFRLLKMQYPNVILQKGVSDNKSVLFVLNVKLQKETFFNCTDGNCSTCEDRSTCPGSPDNDNISAASIIASVDIQKTHAEIIEGSCHSCTDDCNQCPIKDSVPIKLYKPEEAIKEMLSGKTLKSVGGRKAYFKDGDGFIAEDDKGNRWYITNFSNLYSEASVE